MALDPNIPLSVRPATFSMSDIMAQNDDRRLREENASALREQRQLLIDQRKSEAAAAKRAQMEEDGLRDIFSRPETPKAHEIYRLVGPKRGAEILTGLAALQDTGLKNFKSQREIIGATIGGLKALPENLRAEMYDTVVKDFAGRGWVDASQLKPYSPETLDMYQQWALSPDQQVTTAETSRSNKTREGHQAETLVETSRHNTAAEGLSGNAQRESQRHNRAAEGLSASAQQEARRHNRVAEAKPVDDRLVQIMGPEGAPIWVSERDAIGKPAAQAARAVTGAERQSLSYFNRGQQALETITTPDKSGATLEDRVAKAGYRKQFALQHAPNSLQTGEQQAYRQSQRAFTEARLRKESGAAIPTNEYESDAQTYFAQVGDKPETVEQKRIARSKVLEGMAFSAGKAYDEFYGEPRQKKAAKPVASTKSNPFQK
ncbi:MAG TPA: hypothetical protein VNJ04_12075 [Gemmatimonadaceae bacterium]|nr:hypothetical protein [Gemmatimonadaceae bacterium]